MSEAGSLPVETMKIGRLGEIKYSHSDDGRVFECKCDCGKKTTKSYSQLKRAYEKEIDISCGCSVGAWHKYTKGDRRMAARYRAMVNRCYSPKNISYPNYGGRGITVCAEWLGEGGFENFISDMGYPEEGMSLDRVDNNSGYNKKNCRWVDSATQNRNKRINRYVVYRGERVLLHDLCIKLGAEPKNIYKYYVHGDWSLEKAIEIDTDPMRSFAGTTYRYVNRDGDRFRVRIPNHSKKCFSSLEEAVEYRDTMVEAGYLKPTRRFSDD